MITGINESKILTKHISCEYKFNFKCRKCDSNQKRDNDKSWCECQKTIFGILVDVDVEMLNI